LDKALLVAEVWETSSVGSKLAAIKSYRKALGLCYKCGAKWSKDHKCSPEVLLAIEAVWDSITDSDDISEDTTFVPTEPAQLFMALSKATLGATSAAQAIRLHGLMQGHLVLVLVDSGSSASFVSSSLASHLNGVSSIPTNSEVRVAGGGVLIIPAIYHQLSWSVGDCTFQSDFIILPLSSYDLIIGMDWLESFSPMQIHWQQKWLMIPY
jgi:hypothetical protein